MAVAPQITAQEQLVSGCHIQAKNGLSEAPAGSSPRISVVTTFLDSRADWNQLRTTEDRHTAGPL
jgi:hypothetical protein